jgi:voltage-gated potassium channel
MGLEEVGVMKPHANVASAVDPSERIAERFERPLLWAAVLTVPVTILQLLPAPDPWRTIADVLNWGIWLAFLAEVVVMLTVVPSRREWVRAHPVEVAIVVLTPPFVSSIVQSARALSSQLSVAEQRSPRWRTTHWAMASTGRSRR